MRNSEAIFYTSKFKIIIVQKGSRIQINEEHASSKKKKKSFRRIRNIFMKLILIYKKTRNPLPSAATARPPAVARFAR